MGYLDLAVSCSNPTQTVETPASGGGLSQNGKFSYGYASSTGKRSSMEDFFETRIDGVDGQIVGLFGVFDGHGGARAAEYVKRHLFTNLITHPNFISDTKSAISDAYNHTDSELLKSENNHNRDAGSTASTAILIGDRLIVANVGDSRAVISRGGNAIAVSRDHKPDQSDERERIENAGGFVMWAGTWRVGGILAVSRAFGDRLLKQYVVADPEIREEKIDESLEFLILAVSSRETEYIGGEERQMGFIVNLAINTQMGHDIIKGPSIPNAGNNACIQKKRIRQSCTVSGQRNTAGSVVLHNGFEALAIGV